MKTFNKEGDRFDSDNPEEADETVQQSLAELIEMIDQKMENRPTKGNLLKIWKGELNNLISEVNKRSRRKMYLPV